MAIGFETVGAGLLVNALAALIAKFGRTIQKDLTVDDDVGPLGPLLNQAAEEVAEQFEWNGPARLEEVCLFLASPEAETVTRQVYAAVLRNRGKQESLDSIRSGFVKSLAFYVDMDEARLAQSAEGLFDDLLCGCEKILSAAIDEGILSAHEAKSGYRHEIVLDELAGIQKRLDLLIRGPGVSHQQVSEFEEKYRKQIANRHGYIIPAHFDAARKLPITDLYVCPSFTISPRSQGEKPHDVSMYGFMRCVHRCVVLGDPGGGKSTFASRLCFDVATRPEERLFANRCLTPIHVVLREYGAMKAEHNCSLLEFIELTANSKYQVKAPQGAFEYLLLNGRALLVLDGLDELLDTSTRKEISAAVESFCNLYPETPVVLTSRPVGYEQAPLDETRFGIARVAPFDEPQIREYVQKWFGADQELTSKERSTKAKAFLEESAAVPDLCSNPLMLGLMCTIYRGENYIPKNRPDVYEKCALMLFDRWDKSRGIRVELPFEAHLRPAMTYLAHWIYATPDLQGGVTESRLIAKAAEYLSPRRFEDQDEAEHAAAEFIGFCKGRAWVFTDTGTTATGESLYQFTHRTFLEYFAASYLVRTNSTPARLAKLLLPKIAKSEWDVVAQLAVQIQTKNVEGAGDHLLTAILKRSTTHKRGGWNLLLFASRCLEFLIPSPSVVRDAVNIGIRRWICDAIAEESATVRRRSKSQSPIEAGQEFLADLLCCAAENWATVEKCIEELLVQIIRTGTSEEACRAAEIAFGMSSVAFRRKGNRAMAANSSWRKLAEKILDVCLDRVRDLGKHRFEICLFHVTHRRMPTRELLQAYGVRGLFVGYNYVMYHGTYHMSAATVFVRYLFDYASSDPARPSPPPWMETLAEIGVHLLSSAPPWIAPKSFPSNESSLNFVFGSFKHEQSRRELKDVEPNVLFAAFALIATMMENNSGEIAPSEHESWVGSPNHFVATLAHVLMARFQERSLEEIGSALLELNFSDAERSLVEAWVEKKVSFIGTGGPAQLENS